MPTSYRDKLHRFGYDEAVCRSRIMPANAILNAIKSSTHEERMAALVELFKMEGLRPNKPLRISHEGHLSYVVPLVKNGRTTPLSSEVIGEVERRFDRRNEALDLDEVIAERLTLESAQKP